MHILRLLTVLLLFAVISMLPSAMMIHGLEDHSVAKSPQSAGSLNAGTATTLYYPVRLVEHGLPRYWFWYAEIGPENGSSYGSFSPTDAKTMTYYEPPGNYSLDVWSYGFNYVAQNATYDAQVVNSLVIVNVSFIEQYNITVFEKGLPNGTSWELNLVANSKYSPSYSSSTPPFRDNLSVWVPNGTYTLQVGQMKNYLLTPFHFTTKVTVNGSNLNYTVPFNEVNIAESGLAENTSWGLYGSGAEGGYIENPTANESIDVYLPAGNIKLWLVADGYYSQPLNFTNNVTGESINATFEKGYSVTFIEHGLPDIANNSWYVKGFREAFHGGNSFVYGSNASTFLVPNGTYMYNVSLGNGAWDINGYLYRANITENTTGNSFSVNGNNVTVNVYFNFEAVKNLSYRAPFSPGKIVLYSFIGFIVAGVAVEAVYFYRRKV